MILISFTLAAQSFLVTTLEAYMHQLIFVAMLHILFACVGVDPLLVTFVTLLRLGMAVGRVAWLGSLNLLLDEIWLSVFSFLVLCLVEKMIQNQARAMATAMSSALSEEIVKGLLGAMCDAVVRLDESLIIASPAAKLDALLLRKQSSAGRSFLSMIDERDRSRFGASLNPTLDRPQVMHLGMRDDCGALVSVQIFHCSFRDLDGSLWHAIGVREDEQRFLSSGSMDAPGFGRRIEEQHCRSTSERTDLVPISNSEETAFWIDASAQELPILQFTAGFAALAGPITANTEFLSWIKESRAVFFPWLQHAVNSIHNFECESYQRNLAFSTPLCEQESYFYALCKVTLTSLDDFEGDAFPVKLTLSDIVAQEIEV